MRCRPRRNVVVVLTAEEWDRLVDDAAQAERDPFAHARLLVRRGLGVASPDGPSDQGSIGEGLAAEVA